MRLRLRCLSLLAILCGVSAAAHAQVCEHDICEEGVPLNASCDACVTDICAADAYCCNAWWDNVCIEMVSTVCELNVCTAACSHSLCQAGEPLDATCNRCAAEVCQVDPTCCDTQWSATCVGLVETACSLARCEQGGATCEEAVVLDYYAPDAVLMGTLEGMPKTGCTSEGQTCNNAATWYSITAPYGTDYVRHINTCGSEYSFGLDSVVSLHSGCPGEVSNEEAVNDDWKNGPFALECVGSLPRRYLDSALMVPWLVPGGATYKIRISHFNGSPATHYQFYVPEPSCALLGGAGLATIVALSCWRAHRRRSAARD